MTEIYEHPKPEVRHQATIVRAEVGCRVTCLCGWSGQGRNQARATAAYVEHTRGAS